MTKSFFEQVQIFHRTFLNPAPEKPTVLSLDRTVVRGSFLVEEVVEMIQQTSKNEEEFHAQIARLKEKMNAAVEKSDKDSYNTDEKEVLIGQLDALIDQLVFVIGSLVELGVDPEKFFKIVMDANMAKLDENGKPIFRPSDGKIMKPEGWEPPEPKLRLELEKLL